MIEPEELKGIEMDERTMRAMGATPARSTSRAHVHARICVATLRRLGLKEAEGKTMVGDPIVSLGLRADRARGVLDCPDAKRKIMMQSITEAEEEAVGRPPMVHAKVAETLVGRACNLSQVMPEITGVLHGGYRVTGAAGEGARWRRGERLQMRAGSVAHTAWLEFLRTTYDLVNANEGVALAPRLTFADRRTGTAITSTTDASGIDGVGGYVFSAARPHEVWIVSVQWPADVQQALDAAGETRALKWTKGGVGALSMPAAELFGMWAVPRAAMQHGMPVGPVYAVGDCDAAVGAVNAGHSGVPQMRVLTRAARGTAKEWLGVSLPREANGDADRLSHPDLSEQVIAEAEVAGLRVHRTWIDEEAWRVLRRAIRAGGRGATEGVWRPTSR